MPAVGIANVGAKRRHFDLHSILNHQNHAESRADREAVRKKFLHAFRPRIRANVIVRGLAAQFQIAHASAHQIGLMTVSAKRRTNLFCQFARSHT